MDRSIGQLAGALAFGLMVARLGRLIQSGPEIPRWQLILVASVVLGGLVWWLLRQLVQSTRLAVGIYAGIGLLLFLRIAAPQTLAFGILPTFETVSVIAVEMGQAIRLIRFGIPPILPTQGVLAILAVLVWAVGALFTWGSTTGPVWSLFVPSLAFYLQFAVFDRREAGLTWMAVAATVLVAGLTAVALRGRADVGRARDSNGRAVPRRSPVLAASLAGVMASVAVFTAASATGVVSEYGNVPWRSSASAYGPGGGGVEFNRLVDLRQRIISRSNEVVFRARLGEGSPPGDEIYWRMETLDTFDGTAWRRSDTVPRNYEPGRAVSSADDVYQGTNVEVLQLVEIDRLRGELIPTGGIPDEIHRLDVPEAIEPGAVGVLDDSALVYTPGLQSGDIYQIDATYADIEADLGALATDQTTGELSPLFAAAAEAGVFDLEPQLVDRTVVEPPDLERFTELPDLPSAIAGVAALQTQGARTDFERAWMLQHWFRDSGQFVYSTDVTTGHGALDLENWLTDTTSRNYRVGYCEQFSAAMAVLGRALGIPSRVVWGFTPGVVDTQADGSEVVLLRDTNAHAWVEMWIDGFGWVRFDPTPRGEFQPASVTAAFDPAEFIPSGSDGPPLLGPIDPTLTDEGPTPLEDLAPVEFTGERPRWGLLVLPLLAIVLSIAPTLKAFRRRQRIRRLRNGDITAAWEEMVDRLTDLGEELSSSATPMELARDIDPALLPLAVGYSKAIYGERAVPASESDLAQAEGWITGRYGGKRRLIAAINPRSLLD